MSKTLEERFRAVRLKVEGIRETHGFEIISFQTPEEVYGTTPVNAWHRRILSELEFCLQMKAHAGTDVDEAVERALSLLERAQAAEGALTDIVCKEAEECLYPLMEEARSYKLLLVGHGHLDMNWCWGMDETVATVVATFKTMLQLMKEYPEFHYSQSQASTYKIIEDYAPELKPEIQKRIEEGRWEVTASAWVETDKNMPCLESLMNHIVYTKKYLKEHWNIVPESLDLDFSPDTFGHSAFLPDLSAIGGIKYYYHCRGMKETDTILYRWKSPSGQELLMYRDKYLEEMKLGGFKVAVYDDNTYKATANRHPKVDLEVVLNPNNLHANEHGVDMLMAQLPQDVDVLIAIGSGTIHDITRYCAYQKNTDFISCPTAASVDGFCSSVAAMTWHGCKKTLTAVAPKLVVADIDIIKNAPIRLARSGFGDMIGKYIALTDWKIGNILTGEFYCERIAEMTREATEVVMKSSEGIVNGDDEAYENLMYGLLLSGLAMQMMGNSRPASGAEHHISHIIEMQPEGLGVCSDALHGEKVGVGTLLALKEYKRLSECENMTFCDYAEYSAELIQEVFVEEKSEEILEENKVDCAAGVKGEDLENCWTEICSEISNLPEVEELECIYLSLGVKSKLSDIDVSDEKVDKLLSYSPMVRNRLTLMRLRKCMK